MQVIDEHTDRLVWYGEPVPELTEDLEEIMGTSMPIQKYILLAPVDIMQVQWLVMWLVKLCLSSCSASCSLPLCLTLPSALLFLFLPCVLRCCLQEQRPAIESALGDRVHITTALPGMLEVRRTRPVRVASCSHHGAAEHSW